MHSATCLTLGCSCCNSLYEVFLEHTEDDQRRHDGDYGSCKYDIPSGSILSYEGCDLNGNGLRFAAGKCQVRHQVIIPDSQTVQDHHDPVQGPRRGKVTFQKVWNGVHPSICAASSISKGMPFRKLQYNRVPKAIDPEM